MEKSFDENPFSKVSPRAYYPDYTVSIYDTLLWHCSDTGTLGAGYTWRGADTWHVTAEAEAIIVYGGGGGRFGYDYL